MKATIIGGGICGLTVAALMQKMGLEFHLYEAVPDLKSIGAGIILSPNALYIFEQLGIYDELMQAGYPLNYLCLADQAGHVIQENQFLFEQHGRSYCGIGIHRGQLQRILLDQIAPEKISLGKSFKHLDFETNQLFFEDDTAIEIDYVLACDGIHSAVRGQLMPEAKLRYAGQTCWRGVTNPQLINEQVEYPVELWGNGLRFGYVPIAKDCTYWFATAVSDPHSKQVNGEWTAKQLASLYDQFAPIVSTLISATPDTSIMQHDLYDLEPIETWSYRHCLLLGDAAHAMTPNMGQGAAQGIEDAWAICHAFLQTRFIDDAFNQFEQLRRNKANLVAKRSWQIGQITNLQNKWLCLLRNFVFKIVPTSFAEKSKAQILSVPKFLV